MKFFMPENVKKIKKYNALYLKKKKKVGGLSHQNQITKFIYLFIFLLRVYPSHTIYVIFFFRLIVF
mgnify:CR=1 FL=1